MKHPPTAVLVGRTNVGKSSIFNRLLGRAQAIVSTERGTTRDRNMGSVRWRGVDLWLVDTGGLDPTTGDLAGRAGLQQTEQALKQAQVVLLVVDGQIGVTQTERALLSRLRKMRRPVILVINKIDHPSQRANWESTNLGCDDVVMVSAKNGSGLGDLLDLTTKHLTPTTTPSTELALGFIGRTNVGKSSLFNRLLGEERSLVLPSPHTTRDRLYSYLEHRQAVWELIDTAGVRRQLRSAPIIEQQSVGQSLKTLHDAKVILLVVDGSSELSWQDQRLGGLIDEAKTACLILLNKADLVPFDERANLISILERWLPMLSWAPHLWVSAKSGEGINKILPAAETAAAAWRRQLSPADLGRFLAYLKRAKTTGHLKPTGFEQTSTEPPRFRLELQTRGKLPKSLTAWVASELRRRFGFTGSPLGMRVSTGVHNN